MNWDVWTNELVEYFSNTSAVGQSNGRKIFKRADIFCLNLELLTESEGRAKKQKCRSYAVSLSSSVFI
jgi:hypothetical protein